LGFVVPGSVCAPLRGAAAFGRAVLGARSAGVKSRQHPPLPTNHTSRSQAWVPGRRLYPRSAPFRCPQLPRVAIRSPRGVDPAAALAVAPRTCGIFVGIAAFACLCRNPCHASPSRRQWNQGDRVSSRSRVSCVLPSLFRPLIPGPTS